MTELPAGWVEASLQELSATRGITDGPFGSNLKTEHYTPEGPRVIRLQNIGDGVFRDDRSHVSLEHFERLGKHAVEPGDVLVASLGEVLPRACLAPANLGPAIVKADCIRVRPAPEISSSYLMWALNAPSIRERVAKGIKGVGRPRINLGELRALDVPVAPVAEQRRMVTAIEEAFSKLDAGEQGLLRARQLVARFRKSVLLAAVPASPPADWVMSTIGEAGRVQLGRQRHPDWHHGPNMRPYLRVANVFEGRIDTTDVDEMHFDEDVFDRYRLQSGDILLNEGNSPNMVGRAAMYEGDPPESAFTKSLIRFQAGHGVDPAWALLVFRRHLHAGRFMREARITTNISHLPVIRLKPIEFPVPPLSEQLRIVDEVEYQLSFVSACARDIATGLIKSAALRRSVLKAAFEGKLVPQVPSDEPASELLERVRSERQVSSAVKVSPRRRRPKVDGDE